MRVIPRDSAPAGGEPQGIAGRGGLAQRSVEPFGKCPFGKFAMKHYLCARIAGGTAQRAVGKA